MLRIAMISYHTCPLAILGGKDTGGMNVYVRELTKHLGQLGVHVDVFTRSQDDHVPHVSHDLGYGNRVVHVPAGPEVPLSKSELTKYISEFSDRILQFCQKKNLQYDLIHSHYWMSGISAIKLQETWKVPYIQMFHTLSLLKNRIAQSDQEREGSYRIEGEFEVIKSAYKIVASTPAEKSQLENLYKANPNQIVVIPPGVDTAHFYPIPLDEAKEVIQVPENTCLILFVGRIEPLKGIDVLLRSIAYVRQNYRCLSCPLYLAIIGGDPGASAENPNGEMKRLKNLCEELGIGDVVVFLGKRGQDILPYYYSAAQVVVMPSHYESFGMVALEAMACGTPVVASQVGGLAYIIEDGINGFVVPNGDYIALGDKLARIINDHNLRANLSRNAIEKAKDFDWDKITDQIVRLYQDTVKNIY